MKQLAIGLLATIGVANLAEAADVSANKAAEAAPSPPDCFSSLWTYLNSSAMTAR